MTRTIKDMPVVVRDQRRVEIAARSRRSVKVLNSGNCEAASGMTGHGRRDSRRNGPLRIQPSWQALNPGRI